MKKNKSKRHKVQFEEIDLRIIKFALEYFVMESEENRLCEDCNIRLISILDLLTKMTDVNHYLNKWMLRRKLFNNIK